MMGWPGQQWEWVDRPCSENWYSVCEFGKYKYIQPGMPQDLERALSLIFGKTKIT